MAIHKKVLEEIMEDSPSILAEILMHSGITDRTAIQIKCLEKFKYEESARIADETKKKDYDHGWDNSWKDWVDKGYAGRFGQIYKEGMSFREIYKLVVRDKEVKEEKK